MKYQLGIDVGLNSVGFAAVEVDEEGFPLSILNSVVYVHDGGVDPTTVRGSRSSRRAVSGAARRMRTQARNAKKRLDELDAFLVEHGYPLPNLEDYSNPYEPWLRRKQLVEERLEGEEQKEAIAIAVRHMARHRGFRNTWSRIELLHNQTSDSEGLVKYSQRISDALGTENAMPSGMTPAQLVCKLFEESTGANDVRIRGEVVQPSVVASAQIEQKSITAADNANELWQIAQRQGLDNQFVQELVERIFHAEKPGKNIHKHVGHCALQPDQLRAGRWTLAFQRFRIVSTVANLRIKEADGERPLNAGEKSKVIDCLMAADGTEKIAWADIEKDVLNIPPHSLSGTAKESLEGERLGGNPPTNLTNRSINGCTSKELKEWWRKASADAQEALLSIIVHGEQRDESMLGFAEANEFMAAASDAVLTAVDNLLGKKNALPKGRCPYSLDTLNRITARMLEHSEDLHTARKAEFDLQDDWTPPVDDIGAPVGHPTVDRVLKIVNRYLHAITAQYGRPERVVIEHVRDAFTSEEARKEMSEEARRKARAREDKVKQWRTKCGIAGELRRSDIRKLEALERQRCECLYCGDSLTFELAQMDHILPRSGSGSDNKSTNLAAACGKCNLSKGNQLFLDWAKAQGIDTKKVFDRVKYWDVDLSTKKAQESFKREVLRRLKATELGEFDNRNMESVAWMANLLRERIEGYLNEEDGYTTESTQRVFVFPGRVTAIARKASGFEGKVQLIGGKGKTRFDRRHHAMDAAVIAMMRQSVAKSLMIRDEMREAEHLRDDLSREYREFRGETAGDRILYSRWEKAMDELCVLFNEALDNDAIPIVKPLRLRLGNSQVHGGKTYSFSSAKKGKKKKENAKEDKDWKRLGSEWYKSDIDQVERTELWHELMNLPKALEWKQRQGEKNEGNDKEPVLPADSSREIRFKNRVLEADTRISLLSQEQHGSYKHIGDAWKPAEIDQVETPALWRALTRQPDFDTKEGLPANPRREVRVHGKILGADSRVGLFGKGRAGMKVLNGWAYAEFHHVRVYRVEGGKTPRYLLQQVYTCDLARHRGEDLFTVELPPQAISWRTALPALRKAFEKGNATYLGWIVHGDELSIDNLAQEDAGVQALLEDFPAAQGTTWRIRGFEADGRINLEPVLLAKEGLQNGVGISAEALRVFGNSWYRVNFNKLMQTGRVAVIRRNTLGQERWHSRSHLPVSQVLAEG